MLVSIPQNYKLLMRKDLVWVVFIVLLPQHLRQRFVFNKLRSPAFSTKENTRYIQEGATLSESATKVLKMEMVMISAK